MREPPKLADATIRAALQAHYGLSIAALTFLPIGNDSATSVYRVQATDGTIYFLKLRAGAGFSVPSLVVPRFLRDQGVPHILAPLPTITQTLWVMVDDFAMSLYPFIEGRTGTDIGLSDQHWRTFGAIAKQFHSSQLPPDLLEIVPREPFIPTRRGVIDKLEAAITRQAFANPQERELAAFWNAHREDIARLVERADTLGRQLRQASAPLALCHADMHTWNVLLDTAQQMWLVDWDETILALKERDLMFVVGGIGGDLVGPHETACFLEGYGDTAIDQVALTYYRYAWAVQDMAAYGEEVFFLPDFGEETRRDAVQGFMRQFEPGNIVALAFASDGTRA
jgi:spectinomycin phosphotransferase